MVADSDCATHKLDGDETSRDHGVRYALVEFSLLKGKFAVVVFMVFAL